MRAKVKLTTTKDEIILTVRDASTKEILYDLNSKEGRLKRIYNRGYVRTIVTGRYLSAIEKEKIKRIIRGISSDAEVEFIDDYQKKVNDSADEEEEEVEDTEVAKQRIVNTSGSLGLHAIKSTFESEIETSQTKFIHGSLRSGQREEFVGSLVVLGDLNYGAEVVAGENIIVTGTIRGLAHAGANGNKKAIIAGNAINCTQIRIANIVKEVRNTDGKFPFVYLENDDIIIELSSIKGVNDLESGKR